MPIQMHPKVYKINLVPASLMSEQVLSFFPRLPCALLIIQQKHDKHPYRVPNPAGPAG